MSEQTTCTKCGQATSDQPCINQESEKDATDQHAETIDVQLTYEGYDTQLHRKNCKKFPGHTEFIPINEFCLNHLPEQFRNEALVEAVKMWGEMTVRLLVTKTSEARFKEFPDENWGDHYPYYKPGEPYPRHKEAGKPCRSLGSGFVWSLRTKEKHKDWEKGDISLDGPCKCDPNCQENNWAIFWIETAQHVVFDATEAEDMEIEFFYNSREDKAEGRTKILRGGKECDTNVMGDRCRMRVYTHDGSLIKRLKQALDSWPRLRERLNGLFKPEVTPALIVSHPHGCEKVVTVGKVVEQKGEMFGAVSEYNTHTCPGSSGAPVIWWRKTDSTENSIVVQFPYPHSCASYVGRCCQLQHV